MKVAPSLRRVAKAAYAWLFGRFPLRQIKTKANLIRYAQRSVRRLEIGPGGKGLPGFETLDIHAFPEVDYVLDASRRMPFPDNCFEEIYASHVLEHFPWFQTEEILREWVRILAQNGTLELWVPDGVKICEAFVRYERNGENYIDEDGWYRFNEEKDVCKWAAGRIFTYGDGTGSATSPNWHRAIFSARYLKAVFRTVGLVEVRQMDRSCVRGYDHGWINLGIRGRKA